MSGRSQRFGAVALLALAVLAGLAVAPGVLRGGNAHAANTIRTTPAPTTRPAGSPAPGASTTINRPGTVSSPRAGTPQPPNPAPAGTGTGTTTATNTSTSTVSSPPPAPPSGCPNIQYTPYSLGSTYNGLPLTYSAVVCNQPPAGAGPSVPFTDVIYGSCQAVSDYGCPAPLEIQSWPECHRNYGSYSKGPLDQQLNPSALTTIDALPTLPAAMFDGDTRLELYTGDTTVVVFGSDAPQLTTAATALAPRMLPHMASGLVGHSVHASALASASAMKAALDTSASAQILRSEALGTPPPCATA